MGEAACADAQDVFSVTCMRHDRRLNPLHVKRGSRCQWLQGQVKRFERLGRWEELGSQSQ